MEIHIVPEQLCYDGAQIHPLWAYETLGVRGDSIVIFQGPMHVAPSHIRDVEDLREGRAIAGDNLIHFIVEHFNTPASMRIAYYMQRLLIICIKEELLKYGIQAHRRGDDLFVKERKLTVSIATCGITSEKIHCGVNITTTGVPEDVRAIGLSELGIEDAVEFARTVAENFSKEIEDIEKDITKTRGIT
jgi:hypothetical protein